MEDNKELGRLEEKISKEGDIEKGFDEKDCTEAEHRIRLLAQKTIEDHKLYVFPDIYNIIKSKTLFAGDTRAAYNKIGWENKSCEVYPLIDGIHDTYCTNMYDTTISTRAIAREEEDIDKTETAQDFFDWCFSITKAEDIREDIRNEAALIGTSYGMAGFRDVRREKKYRVKPKKEGEGEDGVRSMSMNDIRPTIEHVPFFELFYPLSTTDFYKSQWKIRRKIVSFNNIKEKWSTIIDFEDKEIENQIKNANSPISTTDFCKIWDIKTFEKQYVSACITNANPENSMMDFMYENLFSVVKKDNDLYELIEYWEDDSLVIMINGKVFYDDVSPYATGAPFGIVTFEKRPGTCRGRGIGHKLITHQKQANTYYNRIIDGINMHIDPMYIVQDGQIINKSGTTPDKIKWIPGATVKTKDASVNNGGIRPLELIDFNIIQLAMNDLRACRDQAQEIIGTNSYSQGGQGKIERSFGAVNARMGVVRSRLQPLIRSLNNFDTFMFESWLSVAVSLMPEEIKIRVVGNEGIKRWTNVTPQDIIYRFDFECDSEAGRQATKAERAQTLVNTVNTLQPFFIDPVSKLPIINPSEYIKKSLEQLDFQGIEVMTKEDTIAYLQEKQEIMQSAQGGQQQGTGAPQEKTLAEEAQVVQAGQQDPNAQAPGESDYEFFNRTGMQNSLL